MSIESTPDIQAIQDVSPQINFTKERLGFVHRFAGEQIGHSTSHLDIGLYDGFGNEFIQDYTDHTAAIDLDPEMLVKALRNPFTQLLLSQQKLDIVEMDATNISFAPNSFSSVTCIEVFGAGFHGEHEEVASVFEGIERVLQPGGKLVFTVKSAANQRTLDMISQYLAFDDTFQQTKTIEKGYPLYKTEVEDIVLPLFGNINWYGHFYFQKQNGHILLPIPAEDESKNIIHSRFVPKVINEENEIAFYRIGVCQKSY